MPYIGRDLNRGNYLKLDDISSSFNGSTQTFNLTVGGSAFTPGSAFSILVSVGGVIQEPESAYQVNNSEITFANAPTAQDSFFCIALGVALGIGVPGNGTVNGTQMSKPFNYDGFFYLNDGTNRVGINSSSPSETLDIVGNTKISGIVTATSFSGPVVGNTNNASGISTFYDLRVSNNLTVEGTTTTLDTNVTGVDRLEINANSNTNTAIVGIQSGTADLVRLYDGTSQVVTVDDEGNITTTGNIGINSASKSLQVGSISGDNYLQLSQNAGVTSHRGFNTEFGNASILENLSGTTTQHLILGDGSSSGNSNTIFGISIFESGSYHKRLDLSGDGDLKVSGKVGIGTDNPDTLLHIRDEAAASPRLITLQASTPRNNFIGIIGSDNLEIAADEDNEGGDSSIRFRIDGEERVRIKSIGQVGIGTNNPDGKTHIHESSAGSVTAATDANDLVIESSTNVGMSLLTANDSLARIKFGDPDATNAGALVYNHQNDKLSIITSTGNRMIIGADMISARTHYGVARTVGGYTFREVNEGGERAGMHSNASNHLIFKAGGADEKVRITNNGDVGIGTDNPASIFHLNSSSTAEVKLTLQNTGGTTAIYGNNDDIIMDADKYRIRNNNGSTEYIRILSDGKVGIGTDNPQSLLSLHQSGGGFEINANSGSNNSRLLSYDRVASVYREMTFQALSYGFEVGGVERFDIDSNGHFKVTNGNAANWNTIQRHSTSFYCGVRIQDADATQRMQFGVAGGANQITTGAAQHDVVLKAYDANLILATNATERLRITSDGDIYTSNDQVRDNARLTIAKGAVGISTVLFLMNSAGNSTGCKISTNKNLILCADAENNSNAPQSNIIFETKASEKVRITSDGKVGIGTDSPQEELTIMSSTPALMLRDSDQPHSYTQVSNANQDMYFSANGASAHANFIFRSGNAGSFVERLRITSNGRVNIGGNYSQDNDQLYVKAPTGKNAIGFGATTQGMKLGWDGDNSSYDSVRIYHVDYSNSSTYGIAGNNPTTVIQSDSIPGSGTVNSTVWLKRNNSGNNAGRNIMNLCVDGDITIGGAGEENGVSITGVQGSKQSGFGVSKLSIQPDDRTTAFSASNGDTWHDVVIKQRGGATNNAAGIAFQVADDSYHKNAGTGIAAVKNGTNSDYGSDLVFITRPQNAVAVERLRIKSDGTIKIGNTSGFTATDIPLQVHNPSGTASQMQFTGTGTGATTTSRGFRVGYNGSGGQLWNFENNYIRFATNNAERFQITGTGGMVATLGSNNSDTFQIDGNASQGRTTFLVKAGNATANSITSMRLVRSNGNNPVSIFIDNSSNHGNWMNGVDGGDIIFHLMKSGSGSSLPKFRIKDDGRVSLGDSPAGTPSATLHVRNSGDVSGTLGSAPASIMIEATYTGSWANGEAGGEILFKKDGDITGAIRNEHDRTGGDHSYEDSGLAFYTSPASESPTATRKFRVLSTGNADLTGTLSEGSDVRLKTDVVGITSALSKVNQMRGVEYKWNSVAEDNCGIRNREDGVKEIGVIADEIESIIPQVVKSDTVKGIDGTEYKGVSYDRLVPLLIEAVKELSAENNSLKARVTTLEGS